MAEYLNRYAHLIRYADLAYRNSDGAEFRALAWELGCNDVEGGHRKIEIQLPSFRSALRFLTVNTHVHLGQNDDTLVLVFRGTDWPSAMIDFFNPQKIKWPNADITCVTLGSPRVGNEAFGSLFKDTKTFRIMMDADPIPTVPDRRTQAIPTVIPASHQRGMPPADRRYRHVGTPIVLRTRYREADYGVERRDVEREEAEPELGWIDWLWILVYWPIRILEMLSEMRRSHASGAYVTAVQRIKEKAGSKALKADGASQIWSPTFFHNGPLRLRVTLGVRKSSRDGE
ncbi:hypothetical protein N657DRAFT_623143 [Parathielavia appendiculata]|uniref:Fungal lipase-type domain-containing protein n=1 Tax=Parathielavia appendiculata TaxID=2587402 RepID=A0AAN6Z148_9PEZI|nr:hypothetical protein N657DRAFT_623143 [Parathielavia appendiculata]